MRRSVLTLVLTCASVLAAVSPASAMTSSGEPRIVTNAYSAASGTSEQLYINSAFTQACARPYGSSSITCTEPPPPDKSTACGPSTWGDALVPDGGPWFSFTSACSWHDSCYGQRLGRQYCDDEFYNRMLYSCQVSYASSSSCRNTAYLYYKAVRYFGWLAY